MGFSSQQERPIIVEEVRYYALPADAIYDLPPYRRSRLRPRPWRLALLTSITATFFVLLLAGAAFMAWPSDPDVELKQWKLTGISIDSKEEGRSIIPVVTLNISLDVMLQIKNPNFVGVSYDFLSVAILYRGSELGVARLKGGRIPARRTVQVPAILNLEAREILENASELLVDVAHREVPLTTHTKIVGALDFFAFRPHIDVSVACDVVVDPKDRVVLKQDCGLDF